MNVYTATILRFGHFSRTVEVSAESESAVRQYWIDEAESGAFGTYAEGETLGNVDFAYAEIPARYTSPATLFEHLVCWHLDTEGEEPEEAVTDAEDKARRMLAMLDSFGLETLNGARLRP